MHAPQDDAPSEQETLPAGQAQDEAEGAAAAPRQCPEVEDKNLPEMDAPKDDAPRCPSPSGQATLPAKRGQDEAEAVPAAPLEVPDIPPWQVDASGGGGRAGPLDPDDPRIDEAVRYLFLTSSAAAIPAAMRAVGFAEGDAADPAKRRWIARRLRGASARASAGGPVAGAEDLRVERAARSMLAGRRRGDGPGARRPTFAQVMREAGFAEEDCKDKKKKGWVSRRLDTLYREGTSVFPPLAPTTGVGAEAPPAANTKSVDLDNSSSHLPEQQSQLSEKPPEQGADTSAAELPPGKDGAAPPAAMSPAKPRNAWRPADAATVYALARVPLSVPRKGDPAVRVARRELRAAQLKREGAGATLTAAQATVAAARRAAATAEGAARAVERRILATREGVSDSTWYRKYKDLLAHREEHGHCDVPAEGHENKQLGSWIKCQRSEYTKLKDGKTSAMTKARIQLLEEAGFSFNLYEETSTVKEETGSSSFQHPDKRAPQTPKMLERWQARLQELKEFKAEHGHCNVTPESHPGGLGNWVECQRRVGKEDFRRRDAAQFQKLEELGFQWETSSLSYRWEERFQELKEFKEQNGHCRVPREHPGGLWNWVYHQRRAGKEGSRHHDAGRNQKLEELGFEWEEDKISNKWEARFQELKEFKEEHGHCKVPQKHPSGLGNWMYRQRSNKASGRLDAGRAQKLEELGFQWVTMGTKEEKQDRWEARLRELKEFKEEHGHCNVPRGHPGGLWDWVNRQQRVGKEGSPQDADRMQKLEELGFQSGADRKLDRWEARLEELKEFKEKHGHCNVPKKNSGGGLGSWVDYQRRVGKEEFQRRNAAQFQKLEELGFQWDMVKLSNKWETWFRALKEFKEEHSHCDVPRKLVGGLGFWVMRQRSEKRCGRMKVDRVQRLEELGFQWDTPKTPEKGKASEKEMEV